MEALIVHVANVQQSGTASGWRAPFRGRGDKESTAAKKVSRGVLPTTAAAWIKSFRGSAPGDLWPRVRVRAGSVRPGAAEFRLGISAPSDPGERYITSLT